MIDVGVLKLTEEPTPPYPAVKKFAMDITYLKPAYHPRSGKNYAIIGFPATKNRVRVVEREVLAAPYAYRSQSLREEEYRTHGVSTDTHVVLPLNVKRAFDPEGKRIHFPKPQGMSGSPIVVLYDDELDDQSRVFPVVAVGTTYRAQKQVLIGTDVGFVMDAISRAV